MTEDHIPGVRKKAPAVGAPVQREVRPLLAPRDWQAMALREAADLTGTSEGAARLAESKRYGALADEIERLRDGWEAAEAQTLRAMGDLRRLRDEIERLRGIVDQYRPLADVAVRLDASISWLRDGRHAGPGIGVADMVTLRLLLRNLEDA